MNQTHYRTARKFHRETPSTNFNPESLIKKSNLSFYNATLQQKRKTESKRYLMNENNETESIINYNKTIDFSDFRTHRKTLSVGKQNQFNPLPQIKIPKNKRHAKKGSFLEIWLNEALDEGNGQANQSQATGQNDQTLGALKSYGLDKKMLKSKHISEQTIDKIYKKLYIYTKGLGMTFDEIGKLASAKLPEEESSGIEGNAIVDIFWKAFTKLLENESPYETAFQTIEKGYVRTINELREKMKGIGEEVQRMNKKHEEEKRKQQREMEQMMNKYKHLQSDFNVNKATLQLTDKTLQEQILLRLKFEEKINSVYCSYDEIKTKYNCLVEQIKLKKEHSIQMEQHEKSLKEQLENMTVKCGELQHMLELYRARNRDFQTEIVIKNEERLQLQKEILQKEQQKQKETDQIAQQLQRNKLLYSLLNETNIEKERLKYLYEQERTVNTKFQTRINQLTELNNQLFQEKYQIHSQAEETKEKNSKLQNQLSKTTEEVNELTQQIVLLKEQITSLSNQLSHQKTLKSQASQQLQIKSSLLIKANQTLQKLKQIKDRHQRLQQIAQHDRNLAIEQKLSAMSKMQQQQHQLQNLSNQLLQSKQQADIMVNKLSKSDELAKKKIIQLEEQINKKEKTILTHLNTIQVERIAVMKREKQIQELKEKLQTKDSNIYKLQSQKVYLQTNQPIIEQKLHKTQQQLKMQAQKFIQNLANQSSLLNKVHVIEELLKIKNNQTHIQTEGYKKLTQYYKQMFMEKRNFIHPMIYEDLLGVLEKIDQKTQTLNRQLFSMRRMKQQYQEREDQLIREKLNLQQTIDKLTQKNQQIIQNNSTLLAQNHKLMVSLKEELNKAQTSIENERKLQQQLSIIKQEKQETFKQLAENNLLLTELKKEIEAKSQLLKTSEQQFRDQIQALERQIEDLKEKSQEKTVKFTREDKINEKSISSKEVQTQLTQLLQLKDINSTATHFPSQVSFQTPMKKRQLTPLLNQGFTPQSKQIVQELLNQTQRQDYTQQYVPIEEKIEFETEKQTKQKPKDGGKNSSLDQKKVEKKDFKRALKLTFMRR